MAKTIGTLHTHTHGIILKKQKNVEGNACVQPFNNNAINNVGATCGRPQIENISLIKTTNNSGFD